MEEIEPEKSKSVEVEEKIEEKVLTIQEKVKQLEDEMDIVVVEIATNEHWKNESIALRASTLEQLLLKQQFAKDEEVEIDNEIEEAMKVLERAQQRKEELSSTKTELVRLVTECETKGQEDEQQIYQEAERLQAAREVLETNLQKAKKMLP